MDALQCSDAVNEEMQIMDGMKSERIPDELAHYQLLNETHINARTSISHSTSYNYSYLNRQGQNQVKLLL
jgi:hypothetical protein